METVLPRADPTNGTAGRRGYNRGSSGDYAASCWSAASVFGHSAAMVRTEVEGLLPQPWCQLMSQERMINIGTAVPFAVEQSQSTALPGWFLNMWQAPPDWFGVRKKIGMKEGKLQKVNEVVVPVGKGLRRSKESWRRAHQQES